MYLVDTFELYTTAPKWQGVAQLTVYGMERDVEEK